MCVLVSVYKLKKSSQQGVRMWGKYTDDHVL